jgi:sporulation protein YtfJ
MVVLRKMANGLDGLFSSTLKGLHEMIDVNTVIGSPIETSGGITIIPVTKVSFGFGMGGFNREEEIENQSLLGGSGGGVSVVPVGFLIIENGSVRMLNVDSSTPIEKIIDTLPELVKSAASFFTKNKD